MTSIEICDAIEQYGEDQYDRGENDGVTQCEESCEQQIEGTRDATMLKGFEEGYDEAKETFDPEGGYEDVKVQAYDRGYRIGHASGLVEGQDEGYAKGYTEGREAGWQRGLKSGREQGRDAEKLDAEATLVSHRSRLGGHGC